MCSPVLENKRILVVEDNAVAQLLVKYTLGETGAILDYAGDGKQALVMLRQNIYDFVLMDIQLPEMDGLETTFFIRNEMHSNIPIIAMTAAAFADEEEKCLNAGMNGYIAKPFTLESLLNGISKTFACVQECQKAEVNVIGDSHVSIDISVLRSLAGDDDTYVQAVVATFLNNMPATIAQIQTHLNNGDYDSLLKSAHFAKSSLSVVKIQEVLEVVQGIEWQCRMKTSLENLPAKVDYIVDRYAHAESILINHFFNGSTTAQQEILGKQSLS